jgi:hypothetical protein
MKGIQKLTEETIKSHRALNSTGVYKIYLQKEAGSLSVPRVLKEDRLGLLYFGQSGKSAAYGLRCFLMAMNLNYKHYNHSGGMWFLTTKYYKNSSPREPSCLSFYHLSSLKKTRRNTSN